VNLVGGLDSLTGTESKRPVEKPTVNPRIEQHLPTKGKIMEKMVWHFPHTRPANCIIFSISFIFFHMPSFRSALAPGWDHRSWQHETGAIASKLI
jgi:hypothetical protein